MKQSIRQEGRRHGRAVVLAVVLAGLLLPLDSRVLVPAVLSAASEEQHFAPEPARVVEVHVAPRQAVAPGDVLLVLESPVLDQAERPARLRLALVDQRLARIAGDDKDRANKAVLERERGLLLRELEGHASRRSRLVIRAGQAGTVTAVARGLAPGMWTGMRDRLVHVAATGAVVAHGVVSERDVVRLEPDSAGTFVPDDPSQGTLEVSLAAIGIGTSAARTDAAGVGERRPRRCKRRTPRGTAYHGGNVSGDVRGGPAAVRRRAVAARDSRHGRGQRQTPKHRAKSGGTRRVGGAARDWLLSKGRKTTAKLRKTCRKRLPGKCSCNGTKSVQL